MDPEVLEVVRRMTTLIMRKELYRLEPFLRKPLEIFISDISLGPVGKIPSFGIDMDTIGLLEPSHFRSSSWSIMNEVSEGDSPQKISEAFAKVILQEFNEWLIRCNHSFLRHVQIYLDKMKVLEDNPERAPEWIRKGNTGYLWESFEFLVAKDYLKI